MIYPRFLQDNSTIGICAPSAGVGHKIDSFDQSLKVLKQQGWKTWETEHVRVDDLRGGTASQRAQELTALFLHPAVDAVFAAAGGDFLSEILPHLDWEMLRQHPKFFCGVSDPTGILYPLTTICDIATVYGVNAGSFDTTVLSASGEAVLPDYLENALRILKGEDVVQESFKLHLGMAPFLAPDGPLVFDTPTVCASDTEELHATGRCIGGCIDVLKDLVGTCYDRTSDFISRYREDGFIWYFDNFALSSAALYRTLLQLRYAGWLSPEHTRAVLVGRTRFETEEAEMTYDDAIRMAFPDIPVIRNLDIGHTDPHFTIINGAMADLDWENGRAKIRFRCE
ncbi:MAG: LD-carboxypeptidase [Lachnospiraceae bacterium]|nr:LD-carboxypeptidase [Lachnospiraceae bacterium]